MFFLKNFFYSPKLSAPGTINISDIALPFLTVPD